MIPCLKIFKKIKEEGRKEGRKEGQARVKEIKLHFETRKATNFSVVIQTWERQQRWLVFTNSIQAKVIWEEEALTEKTPPSDWPVGKSEGHFY